MNINESSKAGYAITAILVGETDNDVGLLATYGNSKMGPNSVTQFLSAGTENVYCFPVK